MEHVAGWFLRFFELVTVVTSFFLFNDEQRDESRIFESLNM